MKKYISIIIILFVSLFFLTACENSNADVDNSIVIAEQYGLAYAPVQLIKELGLLEKTDKNLKIEWKQLSNTTSIRESMLAGEVDIAFMAIPPFLIAKDKGMQWKIISGLSESPLGLMTNRDNIKSTADFKAEDKIALPQPGSIQHILLSMSAQRDFKAADKFDDQLLTMNHPDAMNALLAGREVTAHFASPPYLFLESKENGIKKLLSGKEAFGGDFTFIIGVSTEEFYQKESQNYNLFLEALRESINFIENNRIKSSELLADNYGLTQAEMLEYLNWPGMKFSSEIKGLEEFIAFMSKEGYLTKNSYQRSELIFSELAKNIEKESTSNKAADSDEE